MGLRVWLPLVTGFGTSLLCPIADNDRTRLPQTPPPVVFPIVWTGLYALVGLSWEAATHKRHADVVHGILVALLVLWIVVYSCLGMRRMGLYVLACINAMSVCCMMLHDDDTSALLLAPLLAWTNVAYSLNFAILTPR